MSSLEDVFLTIAREAEKEEAEARGVKEKVKLASGEEVEVILGSEEEQQSPKGVQFRVTWTQDDEGKLVVANIIELNDKPAASDGNAVIAVSNSEATTRADSVGKPALSTHASALLRKSLRFQAAQKKFNSCLVLCPVMTVGFFLLIQWLLWVLLLSKPWIKCAYCGPDDEFARAYCMGQNCSDFFNMTGEWRERCINRSRTCGGNGHGW